MAFWRSTKSTEVDEDVVINLEERLAPYHVDLDEPLVLEEALTEAERHHGRRAAPLVADPPKAS